MSTYPVFGYARSVRGWLARVFWRIQCRLNREFSWAPAPDLRALYDCRGNSVDVLGGAQPQFELLVGITSFGRPDECSSLIQSIAASLERAGQLQRTFVVVVRDTSAHDYSAVLRALAMQFPQRFAFYESKRWHGKPGRYMTYQILFDAMRALRAQHALLFEDDVAIPTDFVERSLGLYEAISDPHKAILYLARFPDDNPRGQWVRFERRKHPTLELEETAWFDLHAFVAGRRFFEILNWRLFRPLRWRWVGNPKRSSGVSEQMTLRLFGRASIYQVRSSLAFHGKAPSLLNVEARQERSLDNFPSDPVV